MYCLYERTDQKLQIAMSFIKNLRQYAEKHNQANIVRSVDKVLAKIKEI